MRNRLLLLFTLFLTSTIWAQDLNERLTVVKDFDSEIYNVLPIHSFSSINLPEKEVVGVVKDSLISLDYSTPDLKMRITPTAFVQNDPPKAYKGFIKGMSGTLNPLNLHGAYVYSIDNYFQVETDLKHHYWRDDRVENKMLRRSSGQFGFKYYLSDEIITHIKLSMDKSQYGIYGFKPSGTMESESTNEIGRFGSSILVKTYRSGLKSWNASLILNYGRTSTGTPEFQENTLIAIGNLTKQFNSQTQINGSLKHQLSDNTGYNDLIATEGVMRLKYNTNKFLGHIGGSWNLVDKKSHFYPAVDFKYLWNEETMIFGALRESFISQGLNELSSFNPYLEYSTELFFTKQRNVNLGFQTSLKSGYQVTVTGDYDRIENAPHYRYMLIDDTRFTVEGVDFHRITGAVQLRKGLNTWLEAGIGLSYKHFFNKSTILFHYPELSAFPYVTVNFFNQRLRMKIEADLNSGQEIMDDRLQTANSGLKRIVNFEMSLKLAGRFKLYAHADNLFDDDYQVWSGYHSFGRNLSAGLLVKI